MGCSSFQMAFLQLSNLASASSHGGWLSQEPMETTEPLKAEFGVSRAFPLPHSPGESEVHAFCLPPQGAPISHISIRASRSPQVLPQNSRSRPTGGHLTSWAAHNPFQLPDHFVWNLLLQNKILVDPPSVVNPPSPPLFSTFLVFFSSR